MPSLRWLGLVAVLALLPRGTPAAPPTRLAGLHDAASITRDGAGIAHVRAADEHDLFFLQGFVHAQDRLFQMDVSRRRASGTLAELLGSGALAGDVQLRTFGLRRAAEASLPILSPGTRAALDAYAEGVNAFLASHPPLPPEYGALGLSQVAPWTALDSVVVGKLIAFGLAFDLGDLDRTVAIQSYMAALGPAAGAALFSEDLFRSAPFDPASTVPDATGPAPARTAERRGEAGARAASRGAAALHPGAAELAAGWLDRIRADPFLARLVDRDDRDGSNQWVIAGAFTDSGSPLLANDPHLALGAPSTFYPIHLEAGPFDAIGNSFPGAPAVIIGHNRHLAWGATVDPFDVTDVFQERLVADASSPSGLATVYQDRNEPLLPIPETFRVNAGGTIVVVPPGNGIPAATLIVPRRNGPLVQADLAHGVGLSVQYSGFSPTRELQTFLEYDRASGIAEFVEGLRVFDVGSQNFCYADDAGNVAYFTNSALPIREDLQAGSVSGAPPWLIRDGRGGNEWLPVQNRQPRQVVPFEVLPLDEMPHVVNPPAGFAVNANNDPAGVTLGNDVLARLRPDGGIYYLAPGFDAGFRAGRITHRIREALARGKVTFEQVQSIQADVKLLDAEVLVPSIVGAFASARRADAPAPLAALAADPGVAEAVGRLAAWDFSTPTGLAQGWDASRPHGSEPTAGEVAASVAATLYSAWRGQVIKNVIDAHLGALPKPPSQQAMTALRNLLDRFPERHGVGASGLDFFAVPGIASAEDRRDLLLLKSVSDALALLASDAFGPAFGRSTRQDDWRWGKLHRIVFSHPMGGPFSVPPAFGQFPAPLPGLRGIPTDGGFSVVDASSHDARAASLDAFMFASGPSNRLVVELSRGAQERAESIWPGGESALPTSPSYLNLLPRWLGNQAVPLHFTKADLLRDTTSVERFVP